MTTLLQNNNIVAETFYVIRRKSDGLAEKAVNNVNGKIIRRIGPCFHRKLKQL